MVTDCAGKSTFKSLRARASEIATKTFGSSCQHRARNSIRRETSALSAATCDPSKGGPTQSFLVANAVTPAVWDGYLRLICSFLLFCESLNLMLTTADHIDQALTKYFEEAFAEGLGPSTGDSLLAAWVACFPQYQPANFPYALRALRGWRRLRPACGRHPLPYTVVCGMAAYLAHHHSVHMALAILICFDGYLRPYELLLIRAKDIYPPTEEFPYFSIQICPWQLGRPSKTRIFDDTIRLDSKSRPEISILMGWLLSEHRKPGHSMESRLFRFSHTDIAAAFRDALKWLHLEGWAFVPYCLRHGGPRADRAEETRSIAEVQRRGRWASEKSLRRYEQTGRLHAVMASLPAPTLLFCRQARAHIIQCLTQPAAFARPAEVPYHIPFAAPFPSTD